MGNIFLVFSFYFFYNVCKTRFNKLKLYLYNFFDLFLYNVKRVCMIDIFFAYAWYPRSVVRNRLTRFGKGIQNYVTMEVDNADPCLINIKQKHLHNDDKSPLMFIYAISLFLFLKKGHFSNAWIGPMDLAQIQR